MALIEASIVIYVRSVGFGGILHKIHHAVVPRKVYSSFPYEPKAEKNHKPVKKVSSKELSHRFHDHHYLHP